MKKTILLSLFFAALLSGCSRETTEVSADYTLPEGLSDCRIYKLKSPTSKNLIVVRCPNSSTTTNFSTGKTTTSTQVITQ